MSTPERREGEGGPGDVETAGETTAAAVAGGDASDDRPVGADTLVEVADEPGAEEGKAD